MNSNTPATLTALPGFQQSNMQGLRFYNSILSFLLYIINNSNVEPDLMGGKNHNLKLWNFFYEISHHADFLHETCNFIASVLILSYKDGKI